MFLRLGFALCLLGVSLQTAAALTSHPCLPCHTREVQRFKNSAMGQSLSKPNDEPDGAFTHAPSSSEISVFRKDGRMHQRIQEHGLTADYPVAYSVGYGNVGRSFLIDLGGNLFQSPAAFYTRRAEWGASPGYETQKILDFDRSITSDCLNCHTGLIQKTASQTMLAPITCERCHGDTETHRKHPSATSIVNPVRLPQRQRDSVCEQCHLEGATSILNPGKHWSDFVPGEALEAIETHYVYRTRDNGALPIAAVSQAEQLALSACLRGSGGKLWCGTCHDPHGEPVDRKQQIRSICQSCHSPSQLAQSHSPEQADCVSCHMPSRQAVDVSHAAITDHRIGRRPETATAPAKTRFLSAWQPAEPPFAARNLALALFHSAKERVSGQDLQKAYSLLSQISASETDAEVCAAKGYILLANGRTGAALSNFESATRQVPGNTEYWLDLGVAQDAAGDPDSASRSLRKSIAAGPYDYRPYKALAGLYKRLGQQQQAKTAIDDFLQLVPQSILMRLDQ